MSPAALLVPVTRTYPLTETNCLCFVSRATFINKLQTLLNVTPKIYYQKRCFIMNLFILRNSGKLVFIFLSFILKTLCQSEFNELQL